MVQKLYRCRGWSLVVGVWPMRLPHYHHPLLQPWVLHWLGSLHPSLRLLLRRPRCPYHRRHQCRFSRSVHGGLIGAAVIRSLLFTIPRHPESRMGAPNQVVFFPFSLHCIFFFIENICWIVNYWNCQTITEAKGKHKANIKIIDCTFSLTTWLFVLQTEKHGHGLFGCCMKNTGCPWLYLVFVLYIGLILHLYVFA